MSVENESELTQIGSPLLFGFIITLIYGFTAYLSDLFNLEHVLFADTLSAFASIFFVFVTRFTLSGVLWIIVLPIALYYMKGISSRDFVDSTRLHPNRISTRSILLGLVVSASFFICVVLTAILLGVYTSNFSLLVDPDYENGLGWFIFVFALIPGIWEEIAFRGVILSFLMSKYSVRTALIFDGFLFSLFHIFNYLILGQDLIDVLLQSLAAIPVGVTLAYLVVKTESLLPAIIIHYSIDVTLFISGFIFDLSDTNSALIFIILALIVLPPVLISLFTFIFGDNRTSEITDSKILEGT
jgi:membrane protease YdiL (CAAX protease family)